MAAEISLAPPAWERAALEMPLPIEQALPSVVTKICGKDHVDLFAISLAIIGGICLATGIFYLFMGLRWRGADMVHLTFGLFALAYSGAVLTALLMYRSDSLPQYLAVDLWTGVFAVLAHVFLIWFVATYTDVQPLPVLAALTLLFATALTAHITRPTLIHGEILGLAVVTLPWGEQITFLEAGDSAWQLVYFAAQLLTIGFLFYACFRQYRRGEREAALALGAGLLFFVATIVFDVFVESGGGINNVIPGAFKTTTRIDQRATVESS
jgi:hypothetical protein